MIKLRRWWLIFVSVLGGLYLANAQPVIGQAASGNGAGFTIQMVANPHQTSGVTNYFDLTVQPGQTGSVQMRVINLTKQTLHLRLASNTGYTTSNGTEAYDLSKLGTRSTAQYQLNQLFQTPAKLTLAPSATKLITVPYQMPKQGFNGILEGAFYFLNLASGSRQVTNQKGFYLHNRYALALGLVLRQNAKITVKPKLTLNKIATGIEQRQKFSPAISVNLANVAPQLLKKLTVDGRIYGDNNRLKYRTKRSGLGMAPASNFDYLINTNNQRLAAGKYRLHLVATSGSQRWVFNRQFTVTKAAADHANAETPRDWHWLWWLLLIIIILLVIWLAYRFGKHQAAKKSAK
ncbi:DUF916 and DUF3324 domain-containing protein [Lactiplantibacillus sp. WILCCON 0030]|uniref:DUF916 and DUF3324 domain-containing protein n=1 Tax=Lactiplantibacillus brownii TaxID=3069269 RepID=A0ABU1A7U0_9LACO|nr:DUF916 and DUF3324 domain-containing protein [Lactiplantibacillus brownii]MDQ7937011.1 DUF916 and DUF3324 domain-containing protein [Lactiplantibacillus brownii]